MQNLPVSFVSLVSANPFFGLTTSSAFVLVTFVSISGVVVVSGVLDLSTPALLAPPLFNCFLLRYSFIDNLRFGVTGGRSLGGFNRGSALCVRVSTFCVSAFVTIVGVKFAVTGDGTTDAGGVDFSLNVEYDFVK